MAKPILALHVPIPMFKRIRENKGGTDGFIEGLKANFDHEYHILLIPNEIIEEVKMEVVNASNQLESDIENLEERLSILINSGKELAEHYGK